MFPVAMLIITSFYMKFKILHISAYCQVKGQ